MDSQAAAVVAAVVVAGKPVYYVYFIYIVKASNIEKVTIKNYVKSVTFVTFSFRSLNYEHLNIIIL